MKNQYVIKLKPFVISLLIPLAAGFLSGMISRSGMESYELLEKPRLTPPNAVFSVVWPLLFVLMGISAYLVYTSSSPCRGKALKLYGWQLAVNFLWPIVFFNLQLPLIAFLLIVLLWILVWLMIREFHKVRASAANLNIPYLIWLTFAAYLNLGVYFLNR